MARAKTSYVCQSCGSSAPKWSGQCADCGEWNTLVETAVRGPAATTAWVGTEAVGVRLAEEVGGEPESHVPSGLAELDRVLGGGLVRGSVVLLGGDPGIGKSTLLLQLAAQLVGSEAPPLYVTGEESLRQVVLRGRRLDLDLDGLQLLAETGLEPILQAAARTRPGLLVVDSIQTVHTEALQSAPGSVGQVRECAARLVRFAKQTGTVLFLVGHVTKEGAIAGPRVLEHMVDSVLYFQSESSERYRVIRAVKNRFGAANELGLFAMTEKGLKGVSNPSAIFLSRHPGPVSGSVVTVTREGTRPLLVEIQALVDDAVAAPRRVALGLDPQRLGMLLAVLSRHVGAATHDQDVFINVVGGVRIAETGADLPMLCAVLSSLRNRPVDSDVIMFGEVGLAGEVRPVWSGEERLAEAVKHGFRRAVVPLANAPRRAVKGIEVIAVSRLDEALNALDRR